MDKKNLENNVKIETSNLERLAREMEKLRNRIVNEPDFAEIRAAGGILHDFYCCIERIFERIALSIDKKIPRGEDSHSRLLLQMASPIEGARKEIISQSLLLDLKRYLRFRHLFRNIYGFELIWNQLVDLADSIEEIKDKVIFELNDFFSSYIQENECQ